jgi:secondary thiamine-phosphate synthase enzyme
MIHRISVRTRARDDWVDITGEVEKAVAAPGAPPEGVVTVFIPHTTAGVTIQENADPPLRGDISKALDRIFPWRGDWSHCEDNAASHMKAAVVGSSVQAIFQGGKLLLGTWQNIFLCEFDGPRTREAIIQVSP